MNERKNSIKNNILLKENVHFRDEKKVFSLIIYLSLNCINLHY
jgi:hypothetical protein